MRFLAALWFLLGSAFAPAAQDALPPGLIAFRQLPPEAQHTLQRIRSGGPFPYARDGIVFKNIERQLPIRPPNHYREYTVPTPGIQGRGPQRIVTGGPPPHTHEIYYTHDHYRSFQRLEE